MDPESADILGEDAVTLKRGLFILETVTPLGSLNQEFLHNRPH